MSMEYVCSRLNKLVYGDFPRGPVVKTLHSQCRGPGFDPVQGTRSRMLQLRPDAAKKEERKKREKKKKKKIKKIKIVLV